MSLSSLPEEVTDIIFYQVGCDDRDETVVDLPSLRKITLLSRQFLPSALRALYDSPFSCWFEFSPTMAPGIQERANRILQTLRADQNRLGRLVRSTTGLSSWVMDYILDEGEQDHEPTAAQRWYLEILKSCPALRFAEFNVSSVNMVRSVAEAILEAVPTITSIEFFDYTNSRIESESTLSETHKILGSLFSKPLLYAESSYLDWDEEEGACTASLPIAVRTVDVTTTLGSLDAVLPLLPASTITPPLRYLKIHFDGEAPGDLGKLEIIGRRAGPILQTLEQDGFTRSPEVHLLSYGRHHSGSAVPPDAFFLFPVLTTLNLRHTHGPSLAFIETLATRSPLLEVIDFHDSCWVNSSDPRSIRPHEIFPERQILACLLRFKHLKFVDLGILPTCSWFGFRELERELKQRSVRTCYDIC